MNELKQIRSMAEMILEKVTALEGANTFSQNSFSEFGPKFKVGDSVCTTVGEAGKITGIHKLDGHYRYRYLVLFDNGDHHHVVEPLLQLIKPEPKFRVGDCVVYQSSGEQGTVIDASIGSMGIEYIVWQPDNKFAQPHTSTPAADLVKAPKFKVGDRVRIEELVAKGEDAPVGTVVNVYLGSNTIYDISINDDPRFGSGHRRKMVWEKYLTKVVESKFKVGDRVVGDFDRTTKIGTITLQYGSGGEWYVVEWDDKTTNSVSIHDKHSDNIRLATKDDREWHSGPPPHVGWWNASHNKGHDSWRWWNGSSWSERVSSYDNAKQARGQAMWVTTDKNIQWTDYWPANARVPRIDPSKV
jgi:hypothetical protein